MRGTRGSRRLFVWGLVLAMSGLAGCRDPDERFARHVARAEAYVAEQQFADAVIELQNALALRPGSAELNQRMGELLVQVGNPALAAFHFGEAYRLDPARPGAALRHARLLVASQPGRARRLVADALTRHPEHAGLQRADSEIALEAGDIERALAAAQRAAELEPDSPQSWLQLGFAHRARAAVAAPGSEGFAAAHSAALEAFARVEELSEGDVAARVETAQLLAELPDRGEDALRAFRRALALCRERGLPRRAFVAALAFEQYARQRGDAELVEEALRAQLEAEPRRWESWSRLARAAARSGADDRGWSVMEEMLAAWPGSPSARVAASAHLVRTGRVERAVSSLGAAVDAGLDDPLVFEQLVRIELGRNRLEAARSHAARAARRHPEHPVTRRSQARVALAERRLDEALSRLGEAASDPPDPESELLRALVELQRGHLASARTALARSLAGGFTEAGMRLDALLRARAGEWAELLASLDALRDRGYALRPSEHVLEARALYERGNAETGRGILLELLARPGAPAEAALEYALREGSVDPETARNRLEELLAAQPRRFDLLEALTRLDRAADPEAALARLDAALSAGVTGPRLLLLRAELLAGSGQLARAEADAMRALELGPQLPWAVDVAHAIYRAQGREAELRRALGEAEAGDALHAGARVLLARLHLTAGDADAARQTYERSIEAYPDLAPAKNDLAFLLAARGETLERAQDLALAAQKALPANASVSDTVGFVLLQRGHAEAAAEQFRHALEQARPGDPSLPTFHYHLGLAASELGMPRAATRNFERALALDPHFRGAADARARLSRSDS